jgi:hypothetical protein
MRYGMSVIPGVGSSVTLTEFRQAPQFRPRTHVLPSNSSTLTRQRVAVRSRRVFRETIYRCWVSRFDSSFPRSARGRILHASVSTALSGPTGLRLAQLPVGLHVLRDVTRLYWLCSSWFTRPPHQEKWRQPAVPARNNSAFLPCDDERPGRQRSKLPPARLKRPYRKVGTPTIGLNAPSSVATRRGRIPGN